MTHVLRTLKRQENSLYNCVASIVDDAEFVAQISRLYPALATYANLRYAPWHSSFLGHAQDGVWGGIAGVSHITQACHPAWHRCGLWYLEQPSSTCYFKSTDGHNGNWSFSTTRLNLSVAEHAARSGGCIIIDATRRGKTFPVSSRRCSMLA
jgi:tRNA A64-2'-O-ribosylphosphate transferase